MHHLCTIYASISEALHPASIHAALYVPQLMHLRPHPHSLTHMTLHSCPSRAAMGCNLAYYIHSCGTLLGHTPTLTPTPTLTHSHSLTHTHFSRTHIHTFTHSHSLTSHSSAYMAADFPSCTPFKNLHISYIR